MTTVVTTRKRDPELAARFDHAMRLRDAGALRECISELELLITAVVAARPKRDPVLLLHTFMQLGYVHGRLGDNVESTRRFADAVEVGPRSELASLGLFHAHFGAGRHRDALAEMVRFLSVTRRDSPGYRELLVHEPGGERTRVAPELSPLVREARALLARHPPRN